MPEKLKILIVDDDPIHLSILEKRLLKNGFEVIKFNNGSKARERVEQSPVDLIISDYMMPGMDGLKLLETLKNDGIEIPFIIITAYGNIDGTMKALKLGATEYLTKPINPTELILTIQKALNINQIKRDLSRLQKEVESKYRFEGLIGQSSTMQTVFSYIHKSAQCSANVLITGETGTGKELIAKAIHYNGSNKKGPFVAANCTAFSSGILESELFGHVKGAFTGAFSDNKGRFELADQGTLFLDEIGDVPLSTQSKLLRVIQEKEFERVGGQATIHSDFRLITATNKNLKEMVKAGQFREDLYYRISVINIDLPPLRERAQDIHFLIKHFLTIYNRLSKKEVKTVSIEALKMMQNYFWPGNVRQLEHAVESAVALCDGDTIKIDDLPLELHELPSEKTVDKDQLEGALPHEMVPFEKQMITNTFDIKNVSLKELKKDASERIEKSVIFKVLEHTGWNRKKAAKILKISYRALLTKITDLDIAPVE